MRGASLLLLAATVATVSSMTVKTHTAAPLCIDLQCPAIALDLGEQKLVNDVTFTNEQCESCAQCTNHGYSVCLRLAGRAPGARRCSCAHSTPANCHNSVMPSARRPVNITMANFNICYLSSIQSPPTPLATLNHAQTQVVVTVESFWTEPYFKTLELENLTLHFEHVLQNPEHCEGEVRTTEPTAMGGMPVHTCFGQQEIAMSGAGAEGGKKPTDDYEHSEGFDVYDDDLPPEVVFDREHFHLSPEVKFYYSVQVHRPRQLSRESPSDPFRDVTTEISSEVLIYRLPEYAANAKKHDGKEVEASEEDEEEFPADTDFFAGDKKEEKARKEQREKEAAKERLHVTDAHHDDEDEEDERDKNVLTSVHAEVVETSVRTELTTEIPSSSAEKEETTTKAELEDGWEEPKPTSDELITEDLLSEHSLNSTEVHSGSASSNSTATAEGSEENEEEAEDDDVTSTLEPSESAEIEAEIEKERDETEDSAEEGAKDGAEETTPEPADDDGDVEKSAEEEADKMAEVKRLLSLFHPSDKWGLARLVFGTTLALCLLIILITCCCKRDVICGKPATKTAGGYKYNAAGQQPQSRPLVVDREPLNQ